MVFAWLTKSLNNAKFANVKYSAFKRCLNRLNENVKTSYSDERPWKQC